MAEDDWGEFEFAVLTTPHPLNLYSDGSAILYQTREGTWVPGKVISVDISIVPPSYCVEVDGNLRETEEWRLKDPSSVSAAETPTSSAAPLATISATQQHPPLDDQFDFNGFNIGQEAEKDDDQDDFGDFSVAPDPPQPSASPPSFHSSPSHTSPAAASPKPPKSPPSTGGSTKSHTNDSIEKSFRKFLSVAAPNIAHTLEEQDAAAETTTHNEVENGNSGWEDDFGDFTETPPPQEPTSPPVPTAVPAAAAAAPTPLSPFLRNLSHLHDSSTPHINGNTHISAPIVKNSNAVQEYGVAWASLLTTAAEKLEAGRLFWQNIDTDTDINDEIKVELLENHQAQTYFAALGRIYYVASLVRLSAEMLGLLHFVQELETAWTRCTTAWNSSISNFEMKSLSWVSSEAAKKLGLDRITTEIQSVDEEMAVVLPTLSLDDFPRMLAWSEGLDAILLLPLSVIAGSAGGVEGEETMRAAGVVNWPEGSGRQCLAAVANFWLGCVSSIPPELE